MKNETERDEDRCEWLETAAAEDFALTPSRADLVADICENGQRPLTSTERFVADRMMEEWTDQRRRTIQ